MLKKNASPNDFKPMSTKNDKIICYLLEPIRESASELDDCTQCFENQDSIIKRLEEYLQDENSSFQNQVEDDLSK